MKECAPASANGTLTICLEGNIAEDRPSDRHRYTVSVPTAVGVYPVDFSFRAPRYVYTLQIVRAAGNTLDIVFGEKAYTLTEGERFLFDEREYQASYDGPWFTGVDCFSAIWVRSFCTEVNHGNG